jgi:predicted permease
LIARLAGAASQERATSEIAAIGARLDEQLPLQNRRSWQILSAESADQSPQATDVIWIIFALPLLALVVVCTNLANMVVSRGFVRRHELAIRSSLGASRLRLVLEELAEPVILAICGGALSLVVTISLLNWVASVLSAPIASLTGGLVFEWRLEPRVWAVAGISTFFAVVTFGVVPAIQLTGRRLTAITSGDNLMGGQRWRGRQNLVALQVFVSVALSLLALIGSKYVSEHLSGGPDQPTNINDLVMAHLPYEGQQYGRPAAQQSIVAIASELQRSFGPNAVALASYPPFAVPWLPWIDARVFVGSAPPIEDDRTLRETLIHSVAGDYFETLSYEVASGRFFDERDSAESESVVILTEQVARDVYGSTPAIGRRLYWKQAQAGLEVGQSGAATVVGIVRGWGDAERVAYMPFTQRYQPALAVLARVDSSGVASVIDRVRTAIIRADPNVAMQVVGRADAVAGGPRLLASFVVIAVGALAITVLLLSMSGLYGVLSQVVSQRRREMGLRIALGASGGNIVRLILWRGMAPIAEGCLIGAGVAAVLRQLLQTGFEKELSGLTVWMLLLVILPLLLVGLATCYLPARLAAKVDPNVVLRNL